MFDRFDHVSMVVRDFDNVATLLDFLGATSFDGGYENEGDFHWMQYDLPGWGRLEMIRTESSDPDHFINRFLQSRGEGLHHLTFKVARLQEAVEEAKARGFTVVGYDDSDPEWKEAFLHPSTAHGVLIQLAEFADH